MNSNAIASEIRIDKSWLGASREVWFRNPTIWLVIAIVLIFATGVAGYYGGELPLFGSFMFNAVGAYLCFYTMHESSHRIAHAQVRVNDWIGRFSAVPLLISFSTFRDQHMRHHAHTNDSKEDPDFGVSRRPVYLLPLWLYFPFSYRRVYFCGPRKVILEQTAFDLFLAATAATAFFMGHLFEFFMLAVAPAMVAVPILAFAFSYLPHFPFSRRGRFEATREAPSRLLNVLLFGQNYHLTHHLWVTVPWFRLQQLHTEIREQLRARECCLSWKF